MQESTGSKRRTLENTDGGGEVVDSSGSLQSGSHDGDGWDEIVSKGVVKVSLHSV